MDVFLQRNGMEITACKKDTFQMMMDLASGRLSKDEVIIITSKANSMVFRNLDYSFKK